MRKTESLFTASPHSTSPGEALQNLKPLIDELLRDTEHGLPGVIVESASHDIIAAPGVESRKKGLLGTTTEYFDVTNYVASAVLVISYETP